MKKYRISILALVLVALDIFLTKGLVLVSFLLGYGLFEFAVKKIYRKNKIGNDEMSTFGMLSLIIISIVTVGLIWGVYFLFYGFIHFYYHHVSKGQIKMSGMAKLSVIITTILTVGTVWIIYLLSVGTYELYTCILINMRLKHKYRFTVTGVISLILIIIAGVGLNFVDLSTITEFAVENVNIPFNNVDINDYIVQPEYKIGSFFLELAAGYGMFELYSLLATSKKFELYSKIK